MIRSDIILPNIALIGKAGAGKTTAAHALSTYGYTPLSIAGPLKRVAALIWGTAARTDRDKLQRLGVAVRGIDPDAWINLLIARLDDESRVCVDDVRFPNEVAALKRAGFTFVRVNAARNERVRRLRANGKLQDESQLEHESETAIDDVTPDFEANNEWEKVDLQIDLLRILNETAR